MSDKTGIEWTNATWNPLRGCTRVSAGCQHCYAETVAGRFSGPGLPYEGLTKLVSGERRWTGKVNFVGSALDQPLRWKKPRKIFVNSMSDLFHEAVPDEWIDRIFAVMALAHQHTFQILTKRPDRITIVGLYGNPDPRIDWVIVGGESGTHARPMHPDWAQSLRDQCTVAGVPFFFKQWGEWLPLCQTHGDIKARDIAIVMKNGTWHHAAFGDRVHPDNGTITFNLGKRIAGSRLDGIEHKEFPNA